MRNCANQPPEKCHADPAHLHADGEGQDIECRDVRNAHHLEKLGRSFALGTASTGTPHLPGCLTHYRTSRTPQPHCITSAQPLPPPPDSHLCVKFGVPPAQFRQREKLKFLPSTFSFAPRELHHGSQTSSEGSLRSPKASQLLHGPWPWEDTASEYWARLLLSRKAWMAAPHATASSGPHRCSTTVRVGGHFPLSKKNNILQNIRNNMFIICIMYAMYNNKYNIIIRNNTFFFTKKVSETKTRQSLRKNQKNQSATPWGGWVRHTFSSMGNAQISNGDGRAHCRSHRHVREVAPQRRRHAGDAGRATRHQDLLHPLLLLNGESGLKHRAEEWAETGKKKSWEMNYPSPHV